MKKKLNLTTLSENDLKQVKAGSESSAGGCCCCCDSSCCKCCNCKSGSTSDEFDNEA
ncbi:MAG: hypothetical protein GY765_32490 [bacterium]|nr:hypothetical protein [bacterium]